MFLNLKTSSISIHSEADLPNEKGVLRGRQIFHCSVYLDGHEYLALDTGEIFQNPRYARKEKIISASVTVHQAKNESYYVHNKMTYEEEIVSDPMVSSPANLRFIVFVPAGDFQQLVSNSRSGLLPSTIRLELQHDLFNEASPIKYGSVPDGSGKKWHNRDDKNRRITIQGISFHYDVLKPTECSTAPATAPSFTGENADAHARQISAALTSLREIRTIGWFALGIALAIAYYLKH